MGDRANIFVIDCKQSGPHLHGIYLYTHWNGEAWPEMLRETLTLGTARSRWDDPPYLTRILVSHLYSDLGVGATGGGIGTERTNGEYEVIVLDMVNKRVAFAAEGSETTRQGWYDALTFDEYCEQDEALYPGGQVIDAEVMASLELEA